ncbi:protein FAR1-RELATED SEQUENCE 5-like [Macadamia integrifolia]|uniref:protein FAR1-RELATED SEQUENCE 5-like n=1 Tax=Macadamia integrifolia TaxID=60698 RepID=UPI001C4FE5DD|nr:protein FAR1-RELATED SEQUENCE 5-like [Macadamia integrifolia]
MRGGVKLFGVRLTDGSIKKSVSVENLSAHYCSSSSTAASPNPGSPSFDPLRDPTPVTEGYVSDDPAHASCSSNWPSDRKKGNAMGDQDIGLDVEIEPRVSMIFNSKIEAYKFYNSYGGRMDFNVRRDYAHWSRTDKSILTLRKFAYSKQGLRKKDKRDVDTKIPRAKRRTNCNAQMGIVRVDNGQYQYAHAIQIDLADDSGIKPKAIFEYMSMQAGGKENIGFIRQDQKNYLRTKCQLDLSYGEAVSLLMYFEKQTRGNPSFTYALQLDSEEQITNIIWADPKMLIDYTHFGDVVNFDMTLCTNIEYRSFGVFTGFNHHKDQDAAMGKAISEVFPDNGMYEEVIAFENAWMKLRIDYLVTDSSCLDLVQFFKHFERMVTDKRYNELKAKFDARNKTPRNFFLMSPIMNQALEIYTPKIFEELQHEYIWITACFIKFWNKSAAIDNYIAAVVDREGNFNVECNPVGPTIACNCKKFETFGILCCHALKIFDVLDIKFIPANYVLRRWTRGGRSMIVKVDDGT